MIGVERYMWRLFGLDQNSYRESGKWERERRTSTDVSDVSGRYTIITHLIWRIS
jgi:hypothetical protein